MCDYNLAKIYKLISPSHPQLRYYGSTCRDLNTRFNEHKYSYKNNRYCSSRDLLKYDDVQIILLEDYPCDSLSKLKLRERKYIEKYNCVNKSIPGRIREEYDTNYYQNNKQIINIKQNQKIQCECGSFYSRTNKSKHYISKKHLQNI